MEYVPICAYCRLADRAMNRDTDLYRDIEDTMIFTGKRKYAMSPIPCGVDQLALVQ